MAIGVSATASAASKALAINEKTQNMELQQLHLTELNCNLILITYQQQLQKHLFADQVQVNRFLKTENIYQQILLLDVATTYKLVKINAGTNSYTASAMVKIITAGASGNNSLTLMQA